MWFCWWSLLNCRVTVSLSREESACRSSQDYDFPTSLGHNHIECRHDFLLRVFAFVEQTVSRALLEAGLIFPFGLRKTLAAAAKVRMF